MLSLSPSVLYCVYVGGWWGGSRPAASAILAAQPPQAPAAPPAPPPRPSPHLGTVTPACRRDSCTLLSAENNLDIHLHTTSHGSP